METVREAETSLTCAYICVHMYACCAEAGVQDQCLPQLLSALFLETGSPMEPETHEFD